MVGNSSAKHYQKQRKVTKNAHERHQSFSGKKSNNMVANDKKTFRNMKNKSWLSIETIVLKCEKRFVIMFKRKG